MKNLNYMMRTFFDWLFVSNLKQLMHTVEGVSKNLVPLKQADFPRLRLGK